MVLGWGWAKKPANLELLRGMDDGELNGLHFSLGMSIRNELGLWSGNDELVAACGVSHPDDASGVILRALRDHLVETATPEQRRRAAVAAEERRAEAGAWNRLRAEKDAAITDRRCPRCGVPCPRYRRTCKHCGFEIGRDVPP